MTTTLSEKVFQERNTIVKWALLPPVRTLNPRVLGSSEPTHEEPLRRRGAQGVVCVRPSRLDPNRGVQG